MAYPNCYLRLIQGSSYIATLLFAIQASNGSTTRWPQNGPSTSAPLPPVQAPNPPATVSPQISRRPAIALPTDGSGNQYTMDRFDCWAANMDFNHKCWNVLNLDTWLAEWFRFTPQCSNGNTTNCNEPLLSGQGQEAWTTTFLREAEGPGPDCTMIPAGSFCSYSSTSPLGADDSPLTKARYRYVVYSIYGQCPSHQLLSFRSCIDAAP